MQVTTIGLDLAKRVFQVHGVDADGRVAVRRKLQRGEVAAFFADLPPCRVGIEACATAHHWARLIGASGHQVRLIPPSYVKPYVRRSKTDAADAAAICEAVGRPSMRFVPAKSADQQAALLHHRVRDLLVRQRTYADQCTAWPLCRIRHHCTGGSAPRRRSHQPAARCRVMLTCRHWHGRRCEVSSAELQAIEVRIEAVEAVIVREHRTNPVSRRLASIPGIGPITASAIAATVRRSLGVQVRPRTGGMDRLGSAAALKRGQTEARTRVQARRPLFKTLAHHWRHLGNAPIAGQNRRALGLGRGAVGSPSVPVGLVSTGEQDGADRLGSHGAAGGL